MKLRNAQGVDQLSSVTEEAKGQPLQSNDPRDRVVDPPQTFEQGVFRQTLKTLGRRPIGFVVIASLYVVFEATSDLMLQTLMGTFSSEEAVILAIFLLLFCEAFVGRFIQYQAAILSAKKSDALGGSKTIPIHRGGALKFHSWLTILFLNLLTCLVFMAARWTGSQAMESAPDLGAFNLLGMINLIYIPLCTLVTCRLIFAPLIAATKQTDVIRACRESIVMTEGIGMKAAAWTLLAVSSEMLANWVAKSNPSVLGHLGYLVPLFLYVLLGVWYTRLSRLWLRTNE